MPNINNLSGKRKLLEQVYKLAFKYEHEHHCCSQCTVAALQKIFQIKSEEFFRLLMLLEEG